MDTLITNASHKTNFIRDDCSFFIKMPKILSTSNVRLFLNNLPYVQADIFLDLRHWINNVGPIHPIVGSNIMLNYQ
jgi:hypothetical protein